MVPSDPPPDLLCPSPRDRPHCTSPVGRRWASAAVLGTTQLPLHSCLPAMPQGPLGKPPGPASLASLLCLPSPFSLHLWLFLELPGCLPSPPLLSAVHSLGPSFVCPPGSTDVSWDLLCARLCVGQEMGESLLTPAHPPTPKAGAGQRPEQG